MLLFPWRLTVTVYQIRIITVGLRPLGGLQNNASCGLIPSEVKHLFKQTQSLATYTLWCDVGTGPFVQRGFNSVQFKGALLTLWGHTFILSKLVWTKSSFNVYKNLVTADWVDFDTPTTRDKTHFKACCTLFQKNNIQYWNCCQMVRVFYLWLIKADKWINYMCGEIQTDECYFILNIKKC